MPLIINSAVKHLRFLIFRDFLNVCLKLMISLQNTKILKSSLSRSLYMFCGILKAKYSTVSEIKTRWGNNWIIL